MATSLRSVKRHVVHTSIDFSTWVNQSEIRCLQCSEGAGQIVGAASLLRYFGTTREPGATGAPTSKTPLSSSLIGMWVRVSIEEVGGSVSVSGVDYAPIWYGVIDARRLIDQGSGTGRESWACSGIASHLAHITLTNGWTEAIGSGGTTVADYILRVPTFNSPEGGGVSGASYTIDGVSCRIFDTFGGTKWTAKQILTNLIASHGRWDDPAGAFAGGLSFALSAGTLLDWDAPTLDVNGMTLLDAINALISPRRGLTWRLTVSGTTATVNVLSIAASAITVGSTTLPAATDVCTPTITGIFNDQVELIEDQTATYDVINVIGARPWVSITLAYDPANATAEAKSLAKGWTAGQETTWGTAPDSTTDGVWRTFKLGVEWDGRQYGGSTYGLRQNLTLSGSDFTGARVYDSAVDFPPTVMDLDPSLPCSQGFGTDKTGARQGCLAFWKAAGDTTWRSLQEQGTAWSYGLSVEQYPATVHFGTASRVKKDSDQQVLSFNIASTGVLLATVGIREPDPLIVSWTRSSVQWPRTNPRTLSVHMPNAEQWVVTENTVKGVSSGSLQNTGTSPSTIRDDVPTMQSWLAFLRAYFSEPARAINWSDRGTIEHAYGSGAPAPGTLVTTATLGSGAYTVNAVVTRRTWDLDAQTYGTSYTTDRVVPDIEAIK